MILKTIIDNRKELQVEKIKGVDLKNLLADASEEAIEEKRTTTKNLIKQFLHRREGLEQDVRRLENQLEKKKKSLKKTDEKLKKIKSGDWSVLSKDNQENNEKEEKE